MRKIIRNYIIRTVIKLNTRYVSVREHRCVKSRKSSIIVLYYVFVCDGKLYNGCICRSVDIGHLCNRRIRREKIVQQNIVSIAALYRNVLTYFRIRKLLVLSQLSNFNCCQTKSRLPVAVL